MSRFKKYLALTLIFVLVVCMTPVEAVEEDVEEFYVKTNNVVLVVGESIDIEYHINPEGLDNKINWITMDLDVAFATPEGVITGVGVGETEIQGIIRGDSCDWDNMEAGKCLDGCCYDIVNVKVVEKKDDTPPEIPEDKYIEELEAIHPGRKLLLGEGITLTFRYSPRDSTERVIRWSSSDPDIIDVTPGGLAIAKGVGKAELTVSSLLCEDTITLEVVDKIEAEDLEVTPRDVEMYVGQTTYVHYKITPDNVEFKGVLLDIQKSHIADVEDLGNGVIKIYAKSAGDSVIKVRTLDNAVEKELNLRVKDVSSEGPKDDPKDDPKDEPNNELKNIYFRNSREYLYEDEVIVLDLMFYPYDAYTDMIDWVSSNPNVATVNNRGEVKAVSEGRAMVTARTRNGLRADVEIIVSKKVVNPDDISLEVVDDVKDIKEDVEIRINEKKSINVNFHPEGAVESRIRWSTSDKNIVTVNNKGEIVGVRPGFAYITAEVVGRNIKKEIGVRVIYNEDYWETINKGKAKYDKDFVVAFSNILNTNIKDEIYISTDPEGNISEGVHPIIDANTIRFNAPMGGWRKGEYYFIFVKQDFKDLYGNKLNRNIKYMFYIDE